MTSRIPSLNHTPHSNGPSRREGSSRVPRPKSQRTDPRPLTQRQVSTRALPTPNDSIPFITNDCFVIAVLRGLIHVPALREHILDNTPQLRSLIKKQGTDVKGIRRAFTADRVARNGITAHEDLEELLMSICRDLKDSNALYFQMITKRTMSQSWAREHNSGNQKLTSKDLYFHLNAVPQGQQQNLGELLGSFLSPTHAHEEDILEERTYFTAPPEHLLISITRYDPNTVRKNTTKLMLQNTFHLSSDHVTNGQSANYEVVYGAIHIGTTINGGHYNAVVKIDGQWYLDTCFGYRMNSISEANALTRLQDASIIYLEKTTAPLPTPSRAPRKPATVSKLVGIYDSRPECMLCATLQLIINTPIAISHPSARNFVSNPSSETVDTIRNTLFSNTAQSDPRSIIETLGSLPRNFSLVQGNGEIPEGIIHGALIKQKVKDSSKGSITINAALINDKEQWTLCTETVSELPNKYLDTILKKPTSLLLVEEKEEMRDTSSSCNLM